MKILKTFRHCYDFESKIQIEFDRFEFSFLLDLLYYDVMNDCDELDSDSHQDLIETVQRYAKLLIKLAKVHTIYQDAEDMGNKALHKCIELLKNKPGEAEEIFEEAGKVLDPLIKEMGLID